ncbi:ParM/StbA family protein [Alicyclobacillus fastidiosus]|uniref:ParM/StbA family protein n=1 Tax=Alicyclobacillus fastidiosus TaxID=392011 RepID=A0ABV5AFJ3_9BACL|nr:ParM/StbA family protein [Alicyclobacillus fastidiosus]WEH09657.1 ParM/StbA family protein [Alicyclobacillus fastidiosus]
MKPEGMNWMGKDPTLLNTNITVAVDNGNSFVKACYDAINQTFMFPNVTVQSDQKRKVILNQGEPIDNLDLEIVSPSIPEGFGRHFQIGVLASRHPRAQAIIGHKAAQMKSQRPETMITTLGALAYAIATKHAADIENGVKRIRAQVKLGIGLPIAEVSEAQAFSDKLTRGVHMVAFRSTPKFEGVEVEMQISLPDGINVDNVSGIIDLASEPKSTLMDKSFGVADLGGIDLDIAFFKPGLQLDDYTSTGFRINLNDIITRIRKDFNAQMGQDLIKSDVNVIERIVNKDYEVKWQGLVKGNIGDIANLYLTELARDVLERVLDAWAEAPEAEEFLFIGGGATILASYIKDVERQGRPLRFDTQEHSQLRNLRGTFRSLESAMDSGVEVAVSAPGDETV